MTNNSRDDHLNVGSSSVADSSNVAGESSPVESELVSQEFDERELHALRQAITAHAATVLTDDRVQDMALIAIELASNAVRHGGGRGRLRLWTTPDAIYCQVTDDGPGFPDSKYPAVQRPEPSASGGRGLWLVLHFSDALTVDNDIDGGATVTAMISTSKQSSQPNR
jgi:anti-sigma regulatory factor (Ser/Thr protein kinase)